MSEKIHHKVVGGIGCFPLTYLMDAIDLDHPGSLGMHDLIPKEFHINCPLPEWGEECYYCRELTEHKKKGLKIDDSDESSRFYKLDCEHRVGAICRAPRFKFKIEVTISPIEDNNVP